MSTTYLVAFRHDTLLGMPAVEQVSLDNPPSDPNELVQRIKAAIARRFNWSVLPTVGSVYGDNKVVHGDY
jgi:hypothetical protein